MILNSINSDYNYPSEKIDVILNYLDNAPENARVGVRFRNFYYDTNDEKFNYKTTPNYTLTGPMFNGGGVSAVTPTNFFNPMDFNPFHWNVNSPNEYLYVSFIGGVSGITVWPTHPFPIIQKIDNYSFKLSGGLMRALAFDGEVKTPEYRKRMRDNSFAALSSSPSKLTLNSSNIYSYKSSSRNKFDLGTNYNYLRTYNRSSIGTDLINNSLKIEIPVTPRNGATDAENTVVLLKFFDDNYSDTLINDASNALYKDLTCQNIEILSSLGIPYPYGTATYRNNTGTVNFSFNAPLYVNKGSSIIASYETSAAIPAGYNVNFSNISTNYFNVSASVPVYFWNYRFIATTPTRDAFTVSYQPSSVVVSSNTSSVNIRTSMIDNYFQTSYDISDVNSSLLLKRFIDLENDNTLRAKVPGSSTEYKSNEWFRADSDVTFFNTTNAGNRHTIRLQLSSFTGAIYEADNTIDFLINKKDILFNLGLIESGETSAYASAAILPTPTSNYGFKWDVFPPENIVIKNSVGETLQPNVLYQGQIDAKIYNLGIDKTKITLYTEEYDLSSSTYWFPASSVVNDLFLEIKGDVDDYNRLNTGTISAFCNRRGFSYRVPEDSNIIWNEDGEDYRGTLNFYTNDNSNFIEKGTVYAGNNNYSLVNVTASSTPVDSNPSKIVFSVTCDLFRNDLSLHSNALFFIREYPKPQYLNIRATVPADSLVVESSACSNKVFTSNKFINLSAVYPDLIAASTNIKWRIVESDGTVSTNTGNTFSLNFDTVSACVSLSALDSKPYNNNFKNYNFTDTICFFKLPTVQPFDYIAFPENQYSPVKTAASIIQDLGNCKSSSDTIFDIYNESNGMTAYKSCHTENFCFSATPGFSKYIWSIGNVKVETNSNKTVIPISFANVTDSNTVYVSAFDAIFLDTDPGTIYNTASSNNSSVYKQPITFLDFPNPSASITLSNDYYNIDKYSTIPKLTCNINSNNLDIVNYTFNMVLSSKNFVQTTQIIDNKSSFNKLLKAGLENADYIIKENSFNSAIVFLSGNIGVTVNGFDFCPEYKEIISNAVELSIFNGPNMELYCQKNIVSAGETASFYNGSNVNFYMSPESQFVNFTFDNGDGNLQYTANPNLYTIYSTEGPKTPSLTGFLYNGEVVIKTWPNLITVKSDVELYDSNITREFYKTAEMPYSLKEVLVSPNEWQYASTINNSFEKIKANFDYLKSFCFINNLDFPKVNAGFLGTRYGNFKWHTSYTAENVGDDIFSDLKSVQFLDNYKMLACNSNKIEIYTIDETPTLDYTISRIGDGEILENPSKMKYVKDLNRLYILDSGKNIMFVCAFDIYNPENIKITHYWGGLGDRLDRTKLNNPVDFCIDSTNHLYIVDKDSYVIKVYNKNLNWIKNINIPEFNESDKPLSISNESDTFTVTTENGNSYVIDSSGIIQNTISINFSNRSVLNPIHAGMLYIVSGKKLSKYALNGTLIAEKSYNDNIVNVEFDNNHGYVITSRYISKFVDFVQIDDIISNSELIGFEWDSIYVDEHEFVTDYVYNDSFKKIYDNITILNRNLDKKLHIDLNEYDEVIAQYTSAYTPVELSSNPLFVATNEPVLYDTINRGIQFLYKNLEEFRDNIQVQFDVPNNNNNLIWTWKYHYIDKIQRPSLNRNPVSWRELRGDKIVGSTTLSSVSSWCAIRKDSEANHSQICWTFEYLQSNSYLHLTWEDLECGNSCGHSFTWENLETDCCKVPDFIFADCAYAC